MLKFILLGLLSVFVAACGKTGSDAALESLKAGDRAKALQILEAARTEKPDHAPTHYLLFVLYQYQVSQGEPSKQDAFLQQAIGEYSWIAKDAGISPDYRDMEGTLKAAEKTRGPYQAAYDAVYAR